MMRSADRGRTGVVVRKAAVLLHPHIERARGVAETLRDVLSACGVESICASVWDVERVHTLLSEVDLAMTLGGDGSILRVARSATQSRTPILGINLGKLGFLAEVHPDHIAQRFPAIVAGEYWIEERAMLQVDHRRGEETLDVYHALNEVVVGRRSISRIVRVPVTIDGSPLTTYTADGALVATATGSTAYAYSAGGPILHPEMRSMVVVPISPHQGMRGGLVLAAGTTVTLGARSEYDAVLSIDGQEEVVMRDGDIAIVTTSPYVARFARAQEQGYFYRTLLEKLGL